MIVHRLNRTHRCGIRACRDYATIAIGKEGASPTWLNVCEEHAKEIAEELTAILEAVPAPTDEIKVPGGTQGPKVIVNTPDQTQESAETAENTDNGDGHTENPEKEYYVCKKCGEKFRKPEELDEYKTHCMKAHRKDK